MQWRITSVLLKASFVDLPAARTLNALLRAALSDFLGFSSLRLVLGGLRLLRFESQTVRLRIAGMLLKASLVDHQTAGTRHALLWAFLLRLGVSIILRLDFDGLGFLVHVLNLVRRIVTKVLRKAKLVDFPATGACDSLKSIGIRRLLCLISLGGRLGFLGRSLGTMRRRVTVLLARCGTHELPPTARQDGFLGHFGQRCGGQTNCWASTVLWKRQRALIYMERRRALGWLPQVRETAVPDQHIPPQTPPFAEVSTAVA
jgi:hypothetical protein